MCVCPATWVNAARETSTSACQTPVTPEGPTTAFSSPTATDVNAALVTQVPMSTWQHPTDYSVKLKMYDIRYGSVLQVNVAIRCLTAVKGVPAGMVEHVPWLATRHMVSSANVHL